MSSPYAVQSALAEALRRSRQTIRRAEGLRPVRPIGDVQPSRGHPPKGVASPFTKMEGTPVFVQPGMQEWPQKVD